MPQPSLQWVVCSCQLSIWVGPTCSYTTVARPLHKRESTKDYIYILLSVTLLSVSPSLLLLLLCKLLVFERCMLIQCVSAHANAMLLQRTTVYESTASFKVKVQFSGGSSLVFRVMSVVLR
jgi:hypothetical protein